MGADLQLLPINGELLYTFDFTDVVPGVATITSIDYVVPSSLTKFVDSPNLGVKQGTVGVRVSATGKHGHTVQLEAKANLSNNEKVPKYLTVRID